MSRTADYFEFLDDLRCDGSQNMFGAAPYLARAFDLDIKEARAILARWQETYDDDKEPWERARDADSRL